jgi:hypothetical protein
MVLGWSADGRRWKWLKPNDSIIPLGKEGAFDTCGVFGAKQDPLRTTVNDTLRLYCERHRTRIRNAAQLRRWLGAARA